MTIDLSLLEEQVKRIGAQDADPGQPLDLRETSALTPEDVKDIQEIDGILTLHGERIILYIPEELVSTGLKKIIRWERELPTIDELESKKAKPKHKIHVTKCETIKKMIEVGRVGVKDGDSKGDVGVYAKVINPDGWFTVYPKNNRDKRTGDKLALSLEPCINCLKTIDYKGCISSGDKSKSAGQLAKEIGNSPELARELFDAFSFDISEAPLHTAETLPENSYTKNWSIVSWRAREKANWTCQQCHRKFHDRKRELHTHHKDGNKGNNNPENLVVLCKACHAKQPFHGHMKHTDKT